MYSPNQQQIKLHLTLITLSLVAKHTNAVVTNDLYTAAIDLKDKDLTSPSRQVTRSAKSLTRKACGGLCNITPWCASFSYQVANATGLATCKTSSALSKLVEKNGSRVFLEGPPRNKVYGRCIISAQCPDDAFCTNEGLCTCSEPGFEAFDAGNGPCQPIPKATPEGFQLYKDGNEYRRIVRRASYSEAKTACSAANASLPVPYLGFAADKAPLLNLKTFVRPWDEFYIGLTRFSNYSQKLFVTDHGVLVEATRKKSDPSQFWSGGEPNGLTNFQADAVIMESDIGWRDVPPNSSANAIICSRPTGYEYSNINGKFYKAHQDVNATWEEAQAECNASGGSLALTYGPEGLEVMMQYAERISSSECFYVDGVKVQEEGVWSFEDGTEIFAAFKENDTMQNWLLQAPKSNDSAASCICAHMEGGWMDVDCLTTMPFLCERVY